MLFLPLPAQTFIVFKNVRKHMQTIRCIQIFDSIKQTSFAAILHHHLWVPQSCLDPLLRNPACKHCLAKSMLSNSSTHPVENLRETLQGGCRCMGTISHSRSCLQPELFPLTHDKAPQTIRMAFCTNQLAMKIFP